MVQIAGEKKKCVKYKTGKYSKEEKDSLKKENMT